jgi:hypothetical protein
MGVIESFPPISPSGSPTANTTEAIPSSMSSPNTPHARKKVRFNEDPVTPSPVKSPETCREHAATSCSVAAKGVLKRKAPTAISTEPLEELSEEHKFALETQRLTKQFTELFQKALEKPLDPECLQDCVITLMNSKRLLNTMLLLDQQALRHPARKNLVDLIRRSYKLTAVPIKARKKIPSLIEEVAFRLTHANLPEIVEFLVFIKK